MKQALSFSLLLAITLGVGGCTTMQKSDGLTSEGVATVPAAEREPSTAQEARAKLSVELGTAYMEVSRFSIAGEEARKALHFDPDYAPAYHLLGLVNFYLGNTSLAGQNLKRALSLAPGDPEFNNSYGWYLCSSGQTKAGISHISKAISNPYYRDVERGLVNTGLCYMKRDEPAAAEHYFQRAIEVNPNNPVAHYNLAEIAYRKGNYRSARQSLLMLHRNGEPTSMSLWLGIKIEHKLGNQAEQASYEAQLRSRFEKSEEYKKLIQGQYE